MLYATWGINSNLYINTRTNDPVMPSVAWGRNQSLHYRLFSSYVSILILITLIDKVTDSSTVNHKLMPSSEEIILKTELHRQGTSKV